MIRWTTNRAFQLGIAVIFLVFLSQFLITAKEYHEYELIKDTWETSTLNAIKKEDLINSLATKMGYGGFIHHFKNYILRKKLTSLTLASSELAEAQYLVADYYGLSLTDHEKQALDDIQRTLAAYEDMIERAKRSVIKGYSSEGIDFIVSVDDQAALAGFETLIAQANAEAKNSYSSIHQNIASGQSTAQTSIYILIGCLMAYWFLARIFSSLSTETEEKKTYLQTIYDSLPCGLMLTDLDGNVEEMNSLARSMIERVYGGNFSGAIYSFLPNTEDFMSFKRQVAQQKGHISLEAKDNEIETVDYDIRLEPFMVSGQKKYIATFVDISDRIKVFNELKQSHAQISAFNALLNDHASVSETDLAGNITHVNDKCCSLTGYSRSELIGQNHRMLSSGDHPPEFWQMVWEIILRGEVWHGEITNKNKHGERYWIYATIMPFKDSQGKIYKFVSARTDITKIKKAEQALHELAYQDPLTGQPNLAYFKERVDEEIHRLQTSQHNSKLVTADININHLMEINSTFGWDYGDKLISAISSSLDASKIQAEVIAKVSGERFALLLLCNEDIEEYIVRLETEIAAVFSEPFVIEDKPIKVSYASGIVVSPDDLDELGAFAQTASNINNYLELCKAEAAKRHGNNCIRFSNELLAHVSKRTLILHEITTAIENDELYMVYQPQLSLKNDRVVGVEALMRWQKDDGSYVSPGDFIPVLEVSDFIRALTVWSSRQCFEDLKKIQKSFPDCRMGINISANFLTDQAFEQSLEQAIHEFEIKPHSIEIEVTESAIMDDMEVALSQLSRAREKGFRVSIDDFGTGHSSLSYLVQFPVDQLKIDKSFIRQLEHSKQSLSVVNTIITLGKELGLDVIAEGTETRQQIEILRDCDCDEVQGFYYAKPMKLNDLFTWFEEFKITGKQ